MMKKVINRWIFLVILILIIQISATLPEWKLVFEDQHYLSEGILQVLTSDLDNDQRDEFVLVGKNDMGREIFLYWLTVNANHQPVLQWQSANLYEDHSTLWAVTGRFTASQNQLLAISNSQYYLYQIENNHVDLIKQAKHTLQPLNVACGDVDGDGQSEVIVAKVGQITAKSYNGLVQVWKFNDGNLHLLAESALMGNIRGVVAGDLNQDGRAEIVVEEGPKFAAGNLHVLNFSDQKLTEVYSLKKATKGPAYGMQIKNSSGSSQLIIGTATGFIGFFQWANNALVPTAKEIDLRRDIMSVTAIDNPDTHLPELVIGGYPQDLLILAP
ncbi:MAG TPA: hypothetical protein DDW65_06585 [Firmicutes bacterium]|jgi:hypothetical protein|nr:hypothetical protein [Bacillota bacterium]